MSAIPAAPAMIGMLMHAPSRCALGKIGSSPTKVIEPPVSTGESPRLCITERNSALMSKPADTFGVSNVLLVMMFAFNGRAYSVVLAESRFRVLRSARLSAGTRLAEFLHWPQTDACR